MNLLFIGYSKIVQKRVLPAALQMPEVKRIDIASRSAAPHVPEAHRPEGQVYDDYEKAIESSAADLVYVSLANSDHVRWAERALRQGMHVIVDKPAFLSLKDAERLSGTADASNLCLAEATV